MSNIIPACSKCGDIHLGGSCKPSPEAKQAVEQIAQELAFIEWSGFHTLETCSPDAAERIRRMARRAYDTATAKAREEHKALERRLSKEIEYQQSVVAKLQGQLAHQQPSVIRRNPNEDHRAAQPSDEDIKRDPKLAREFVKSLGLEVVEQLSASTADVEELAKQLATDVTVLVLNNQFSTPKCHAVAALTLSQALAPLVEAINNALAVSGEGQTMFAIATIRTILRAALTGTGEKV